MRRLTAALLVLVLFASACTSESESVSPATTVAELEVEDSSSSEASNEPATGPTAAIYPNLTLETPGAAVATLADAYAQRDFLRAWYVFDVEAQRKLNRAVNNLALGEFRGQQALLPDNLLEGAGEHSQIHAESTVVRLLEDAAAADVLLVDFGGAEVLSSTERLDPEDEARVAVVDVRLANDSPATVRLTVSPSGRWRVNQIAIDGADFDDGRGLVVDATCGSQRVRVYDGVPCPSSDDYELCALMQGQSFATGSTPSDETMLRAQVLADDVCPGSVEFLDGRPPAFPPSGTANEGSAYAQLDLSTPEQGVHTFSELFANEAFTLLLFSLDIDAQLAVGRAVTNFDLAQVVTPEVLEEWQGLGSGEHIDTLAEVFTALMREAAEHDLHLLDLAGPLEIVGTTPMSLTNAETGDGVDAVVVEARSTTSSDVFYFLTLESPSGRWRVRLVADDPASFDAVESENALFITSS